MTFDEKFDIAYKACLLSKAGDEEGYYRLMKTLPMQPWLAKIIKDKMGADVLIQSGCNLSEAEAEFGPDWLRSPGLDPIEKALLQQRVDNIPAAQSGYLEKQIKAFSN